MERADEIAWTLDYLGDLEADFAAFFGVEDMFGMPGPRFFRFAERSAAYEGVMQVRAKALLDADEPEPSTAYRPAPQAASGEVDLTPETVGQVPELAGLIDWGRG